MTRSLTPLRWRRVVVVIDGHQVVTEVPQLRELEAAPPPSDRDPLPEREVSRG